MNKATRFILTTLRLVLQIIGTYFLGKWIIEKIASIPASTWGWMALIVILVIAIIIVWGFTIVDTFRGDKKGPKSNQ